LLFDGSNVVLSGDISPQKQNDVTVAECGTTFSFTAY